MMLNAESVLENEMHKILWDFKIQSDHLNSARRPDLVIVNNKKKEYRLTTKYNRKEAKREISSQTLQGN